LKLFGVRTGTKLLYVSTSAGAVLLLDARGTFDKRILLQCTLNYKCFCILNGINGTVKKTAETEKASQRQRNLCDVDGTERNLHHLMGIR